jgi:hypothetical protein
MCTRFVLTRKFFFVLDAIESESINNVSQIASTGAPPMAGNPPALLPRISASVHAREAANEELL